MIIKKKHAHTQKYTCYIHTYQYFDLKLCFVQISELWLFDYGDNKYSLICSHVLLKFLK